MVEVPTQEEFNRVVNALRLGLVEHQHDAPALPQPPEPPPASPQPPEPPEPPPPPTELRREDVGPRERTEPQPEPPQGVGIGISPATPWSTIKNADPGTLFVLSPGAYNWSKRHLPPGVDLQLEDGAYFDGTGLGGVLADGTALDAERLFFIDGPGNDVIDLVAVGYTRGRKHNGTVQLRAISEGVGLWNPRIEDAGEEAIHLGGQGQLLVGGLLQNAGGTTVNGGGGGHLIDGIELRGGAMKFGRMTDTRILYVEGTDLDGPFVWLDVKCVGNELAHGRAVGGDHSGVHLEIGAGDNRAHHFDLRDFGRLHVGRGEEGWRGQRQQGALYLIHNSPGELIDYCYGEVSGAYGAGLIMWEQQSTTRGTGTPQTCEGSAFRNNWIVVTSMPEQGGWLAGVYGIDPAKVEFAGNVYIVPRGTLDWPYFRLGRSNVPYSIWRQTYPSDVMQEAA